MLEQQTEQVPAHTESCNNNEAKLQESVLKRKDVERESDDSDGKSNDDNSDNGTDDDSDDDEDQYSLPNNPRYRSSSTINHTQHTPAGTSHITLKHGGGSKTREAAVKTNFSITLLKPSPRYANKKSPLG